MPSPMLSLPDLCGDQLFLVAGPCVIESEQHCVTLAGRLAEITRRLGIKLLFKASFDKANRTSLDGFRGPGLDAGLRVLDAVRSQIGVPVITDVHEAAQAAPVAAVVDVVQIPAFLCRQTDLIVAAAQTGAILNIKKGQFQAPWDMRHVVDKARRSGSGPVLLTERGTSFGYNNLVVDFRGLRQLRGFADGVIFDATHSVQLPGGGDGRSGGQREFIADLARAAVSIGVNGLFVEVHESPDQALSDGPNALPLQWVEALLSELLVLDRVRRSSKFDGTGSPPLL